MMSNKIFKYEIVVPEDAIDLNNHVSNLNYLRWMTRSATLHSDALGWNLERYQSIGSIWIIRSHFIEYLKPAFLNEKLIIYTWITNCRKIRSKRKYKCYRDSDNSVIAKAETEWVFVDIKTGKPKSIPEELINDFEIVPPEEEP